MGWELSVIWKVLGFRAGKGILVQKGSGSCTFRTRQCCWVSHTSWVPDTQQIIGCNFTVKKQFIACIRGYLFEAKTIFKFLVDIMLDVKSVELFLVIVMSLW